MRPIALLLAVPLLALLAVACNGDDDNGDGTPIPTIVPPTESPTSEATPTTQPAATETPAPTHTPAGTPFPGDTDPVDFDSVPAQPQGIYILSDVRVGEHDEAGGYDRIVFEFDDVDGVQGAHPAGVIEYVDEAFQCGSGEPVDVEGQAILAVRFDMTQAHDDDGNLTIDDIQIDGPGNSILEALSYCDFEGIVQWAIGVPSELDFNVTFLSGPSRVVIDVQHP